MNHPISRPDLASRLQIFGFQAGVFRDSGQHPRANLNVIVEGPTIIGITLPLKGSMRA
jgi:hypothetical protein